MLKNWREKISKIQNKEIELKKEKKESIVQKENKDKILKIKSYLKVMLNYFYTIYILTKRSENFNLFRGIISNK